MDTREIRRRYTSHLINLLYEKMPQKQKKTMNQFVKREILTFGLKSIKL